MNLIEWLREEAARYLPNVPSVPMLTQAADTITAQSRLLALAETLAGAAGSHLSHGDDARYTKPTLDVLNDSLIAYEAAQAEYQTTGAVPCGECEAKEQRIAVLEKGWDEFTDKAQASIDDHYRHFKEKERENADLCRQLAEAQADNAALVEAVKRLGCDCRINEGCCDATPCATRKIKNAVLSQPHPGAPMLERMAALEEVNEALSARWALRWHEATSGQDHAEVAALSRVAAIDAIRNREGR